MQFYVTGGWVGNPCNFQFHFRQVPDIVTTSMKSQCVLSKRTHHLIRQIKGISPLIIEIAAGRLWVALVLTMIASLILGMGLTTTAVYITVAALVVPSLITMGVEPIAAHLFAFYYGLVSASTPPVALAAFAGAGIAGSNPMQTGFSSFRLGFAKYIIPIVFVYVPGMLLVGSPLDIIRYILMGFIGIFSLTIATEGWLYTRVNLIWRILMIPISVMIFMPQLGYSIGGCPLLAGFMAYEKLRIRQVKEV